MTSPQKTAAEAPDRAKQTAIAFVFIWFFIGGIGHFAFTEAEMRIVPPYISWPWEAVIVSGVFELLGAIGLLWLPTRRAAATGLFALTLAVTPAHIYMLQVPELFASIPYWALLLRLPIQLALLVVMGWIAARPDLHSAKIRLTVK